MAGRKSLKEELKLFERYSELTEPYFNVLKKKLASDTDPAAQMWAVEQLTKAFTKMIPQQLTGADNGPLQVQWLSLPSRTSPAAGPNNSTKQSPAG